MKGGAERNAFVRVRGAREHNLRNVDVDVPRDSVVVFTGVSGSGKSSLAFSTIYAEAQRRYFESVTPYARRLIEQVGVPAVDSIEGLPPAVALQQQRGRPTARSSVGSVTTISNLLRMLYSRAGTYPARQPMLYAEDFSPNTPAGACPTCHGLGHVYDVTAESLVPDDNLTIRQRAVAAWPPAWHGQNLRDILTTLGHDVDVPWRALPKKTRDWILFSEDQPVVPVYAGFSLAEIRAALRRKAEPSYMGTFTSARRYVLHAFATSQSPVIKRRVSAFLVGRLCPLCHGKRLRRQALSVTFGGLDIGEASRLSLSALRELLDAAASGVFPDPEAAVAAGPTRTAAKRAIAARVAAGGSTHAGAPDVRRTPNDSQEKRLAAQRIAGEIVARIATLESLGLGYLALERSTPTLSPGELQRMRLAAQLYSQLFGVIYVLDEPSAGLHPADAEALLANLQRLKSSGNSLFVVEHDLDLIRRADWIVDVGPGAGTEGGRVLYSGPLAGLGGIAGSATGRYLFGKVPPRLRRAPRSPRGQLALAGVARNNLRGIDVALPIGCVTAITGISGSGKSSFASQALPDLLRDKPGLQVRPDDFEEVDVGRPPPSPPTANGRIISGSEHIGRLVCVDQSPIGRTPRSNLATYTGLFDAVRRLFAATPTARRHRFDAGRFSFNVAKGRCATCTGEGFVCVELLFLPSIYSPCPACQGSRYNPATLQVTWRGRNIAEVLAMTVDEAAEFFAAEAAVARPLSALRQIGLGYLRLGQPATELSGGEAQRVKLATELQRPQAGDTLYVLDEPTTGLHPEDIAKLVAQLDTLADAGNTIVIVEHDMAVVAGCDWVIEIGPGAGEAGGRIVAAGPPEVVARLAVRSAPYLAAAIAKGAGMS